MKFYYKIRTSYVFMACCFLITSALLSCKDKETEPPVPVVQTLDVTDISNASVTLNGEITDLNKATVVDCGFIYTVSGSTTPTQVSLGAATAAGKFAKAVTGLTSGASYTVKAFAKNSSGKIVYGNDVQVGTLTASFSGFSPKQSPVDSLITITGANIDTVKAHNTVLVGGTTATIVKCTTTSIVVKVPSSLTPALVNLAVTSAGISTTLSDKLTVIPDVHFSPAKTIPGNTIQIWGSNVPPLIAANAVVKIGGVEVTYYEIPNVIFTTVPSTFTPGEYSVSVTVNGITGTAPGKLVLGAAGTWTTQAAHASVDPSNMTTFSANGKGYLLDIVTNLYAYDPTANTWAKLPAVPFTSEDGLSSFVIDDIAYVLAGNAFWAYNAAAGTWAQKTTFPGVKRTLPFAFAVSGIGYIGAGNNSSAPVDVWAYNPTSNTWTQKANFAGTARFAAGSFVLNGKAYVGYGTQTGTTSVFPIDLWEYNPTADSWTAKAAPIYQNGAAYPIGFALNGKGYFTCAYVYVSNSDNTGGAQRNVGTLEYDPAQNTWAPKQNFPATDAFNFKGLGFSLNGSFYVAARNQQFFKFTP